MINFLIGLVVGAGVVGSSVSRTIAVDRGQVKAALLHSVLNSATYWFSIYSIARDDHWAYVGTAVGSTLLVVCMAYRNKKGH